MTIAVLPGTDAALTDALGRDGHVVAGPGPATRGIVLHHPLPDAATIRAAVDAAGRLEWMQWPMAGVESWLPLMRELADRAPVTTSAKGCYARPVAEHALMLTLGSLRHVAVRARATSWDPVPSGETLYGAEVLLVGAGGIAQELLRLLEPFGTSTTVVRRQPDPLPGAVRTVQPDALHDHLPRAQLVLLAAALTPGTTHLFGRAELEAMRPGAVLVNVARGGLVDTDALVDALRPGRLGGAALDVTDPEPLPDGHPLWTHPRALITPHTADTAALMAPHYLARVLANARALVDGSGWVGRVDLEAGY